MTVKEIRSALGLTQEQFANRMGVSFVTISRYELGKSKPNSLARRELARLERLARQALQKVA